MVLSQRITNRALAAIPVGACLALSNNGFSRLTRPAATKPSSPSPADASNGLNGAAFEIARSRRQPSRCPGRSGGGSRSKKYEKGSELRVLGDCSFQNDPIAAPASVVHHHVPRKILRAVEGGGLLYEDRRVLTRVSRLGRESLLTQCSGWISQHRSRCTSWCAARFAGGSGGWNCGTAITKDHCTGSSTIPITSCAGESEPVTSAAGGGQGAPHGETGCDRPRFSRNEATVPE
jgi:hypothetical protein